MVLRYYKLYLWCLSISHCIFPASLAARWSHPFGKLNFIESWSWFHFPLPMEAKDGKISDLSQLLNHFQTRFWRSLSSFSREVPKCEGLKAAQTQWKAFKSKVIRYPCDLDKAELKTQAKRHKQTGRNEMLPRNQGWGGGIICRGNSLLMKRGFSTLSLPWALFDGFFHPFIEMLIK